MCVRERGTHRQRETEAERYRETETQRKIVENVSETNKTVSATC